MTAHMRESKQGSITFKGTRHDACVVPFAVSCFPGLLRMSRGGWATIFDDVASIRDSAQQMSQKPANATDQFQIVNYDSDLTVQHPHGTASIETRRSNLSGQRQGAPEMETRRSNLSGQRPGALEDGTAASRGGGDDGGPRWGWRFPDPSVCEDITPPACDVATQHPYDNASLGTASGCPPITT